LQGPARGAAALRRGADDRDRELGDEVRAIAKSRIRFAVAADGALAELEIRVAPGRFGGWEAVALLHEQGAESPARLGRAFRSRERCLAAGKMVAWVRRRYPNAKPLAELSSVALRPSGAGGA
jgi:hypothetical protein